MRFSVLLPLLCSAAGLVHAIDSRLLYTIPAEEDMVTFAVKFGNACASWQPARSAGLTFGNFLLEVGDFKGDNKDTEAKIVCGWGSGIFFTEDVAASVGATLTPDA